MTTYSINKVFLVRLAYAIVILLCVTIFLTYTSRAVHKLSRCLMADHVTYIEEMEHVKSRYNTLWEEHRKDAERIRPGKLAEDFEWNRIADRLRVERDLMSLQLNEMWKLVGKMQCEWSGDVTSDDGGWCKGVSTEMGGQHVTDQGLVKALSSFLKSKSVGSFGDGPGAYKRDILKLGEVKSFESYDGAPFSEETSLGRVKYLDLTLPQYKIPVYDFVLSIEVAEHIPPYYESTYLDNLSRHAKTGIILSWAQPDQGGLSHVNGRTFEYVVNHMSELGFALDKVASAELQDACTVPWLKENVNVYMRDRIIDKMSWSS